MRICEGELGHWGIGNHRRVEKMKSYTSLAVADEIVVEKQLAYPF